METLNIQGLDKAELLAELYNGARQLGMGHLNERGWSTMSVEQARELLEQRHDFDYLYGRVMKINLRGDELSPWGYDRDNGQGATAIAVAAVRSRKQGDLSQR